MKRLKRNPEKFETLDLFTAFSMNYDYKLMVEQDIEDFTQRIKKSLKSSCENKTLIHGKRVEALFKHIAAALGKCKIIKQEDAGETISAVPDITPPDYKIILNDGRQIFVEVKNCNLTNPKAIYNFNKEYLNKVENYAGMHGIPIYYAIYFRLLNRWVLVNKQSLIERDKKYEISIISAMTKNEMAILGDLSIGTKPALSIELISDSNQEITRKDNEIKFIIGGVKLYCDGKEITNELDKKIAYYLIRFGDWNCGEPNIISGDDKFRSIRYEFTPEEDEEQGFNMIGTLSSMITAEFNEKTIYEKSVIALDTNLDPSLFSVKIPPDYYGEDLPLWIFSLKPNHEFKEPSL